MPFSSSSTVHLQILSRSTSSRGFTRHQHEIVGSFREGFPSNSNKKDGLLHDSATTLRVHLVHIHREFFLSISYDLTQGHRQNAKTHLFQRQNSSRIHSEESLFGKKKEVASISPTTWTTSTRPKSSTLFFHSLSTTSPTFTKIK